MEAAVSQMNVRLSSHIKEMGDAELAKRGLTPTEFVRKVWERLSQGGNESDELERLVLGNEGFSADRLSQKHEALANMRAHYERGMASLGIDVAKVTAVQTVAVLGENQSDRDPCTEALVERMVERGTWSE